MQELYQSRLSSIHRLDARVKLLFTLAFLVSFNLTPAGAWPAYVLFLSVVFSVVLFSKIGLTLFFRRSLFFLPFLLAALPLVITGPEPMRVMALPGGRSLLVSIAGTARFISIGTKSWISVMAVVLLAATTRFVDLVTAMQQLKVPGVLTATISLMWRYLFLMMDEVTRLMRARSSRSASAPAGQQTGGSLFWRAKVTGGMAGNLLLRSIERSEKVYAAMLARGYTGELPASLEASLKTQEKQLLAIGLALLAGLCGLGFLTGG